MDLKDEAIDLILVQNMDLSQFCPKDHCLCLPDELYWLPQVIKLLFFHGIPEICFYLIIQLYTIENIYLDCNINIFVLLLNKYTNKLSKHIFLNKSNNL